MRHAIGTEAGCGECHVGALVLLALSAANSLAAVGTRFLRRPHRKHGGSIREVSSVRRWVRALNLRAAAFRRVASVATADWAVVAPREAGAVAVIVETTDDSAIDEAWERGILAVHRAIVPARPETQAAAWGRGSGAAGGVDGGNWAMLAVNDGSEVATE